jgi:hypothetical protein
MTARRLLVMVSLGLVSVGAIDAAVGGHWDGVAILVVTAALLAVVALEGTRGRVGTTLRADLHGALARRAALDGEPVEVLLDRAVAFELQMRERETSPPEDP